MYPLKTLKKRSQIALEDTWNLEALYETNDAWELEYKELEQKIQQFVSFEGTLKQGAEQLKKALDDYNELWRVFFRLYVYANQRSHEDTGNSFYQKLAMRVATLQLKLAGDTAFFYPEIIALGKEWLEKAMEECEALRFYEREIRELLRKEEHTLSKEMENVLAEAMPLGESSKEIFSMFNNADIRFPKIKNDKGEEVQITHGNYAMLIENPDRNVRKETFEAFYSSYAAFKNTIASVFASNLKQAAFFSKIRKYHSARAYYLSDANIPEQVYDNLIETVHKNMSLMHRYTSLRKKVFGYDKLHLYDSYLPLVEDIQKEYTFEEAKEIVLEGLQPMGEEYINLLKEGFSNRWIDVYENEGKRTGAYSWGCYDSHPYVLLNYNGTLDNVFTLAHEMGHSLHSYYSRKNQPFVYSMYKIFVAEVASTCNEAILIHHLLEKAETKEEKLYLLNHFADKFKSTLYRQTMFAEFEKIVHEKTGAGEALNAEAFCNIYRELNEQYFGPDMVIDDEISLEWMRIPHFYTPFYVYQYATGFSAAIALSSRILKEGEPAIEDYKKFLKGGGSMDSIDLLKIAGVDMTSPEPVQQALNVFEDLLSQMEELCK